MFCNLYNVLFILDIHFTLSKCAVEQTYGQQYVSLLVKQRKQFSQV